MTSIKQMKRNFFVGIIVAAMVYSAIVVTVQYINSKEEKRQDRIPELLILPPPFEEDFPLDLHPPIDLRPLKYDNLA